MKTYIAMNSLACRPRFAADEHLSASGLWLKRFAYRFARVVARHIPLISRRRFMVVELENDRLRHACFMAALELNHLEDQLRKAVKP